MIKDEKDGECGVCGREDAVIILVGVNLKNTLVRSRRT